MAQSLLLFLGFLLVLCFPSANLQVFDGLPFSRLCEFTALALLVPFLIFPDLRKAQVDFWKRLKIRPIFLVIALAAILLLKGLLLESGVHGGFAGCYRSPAEPTTVTHEELPPAECERSYENLLNRFSATRLDSSIGFTPDSWNLVFLNTNRYNYSDWEPGNIPRERIPLEAAWSGTPAVKPDEPVRIEYVGEGTVAWGDLRIPLPPSYAAANVVEFSAPSVDAVLRIDYRFNDGSRTGQDPQTWGPRATMKISAGSAGDGTPLTAKSPALGWRLAAMLADALILLWLFFLLPVLWNSIRRDLLALILFCVGIGVFVLLPVAPLIREIGVTGVLAIFLISHLTIRPFRPTVIYAAVAAAAFAILHVWSSGFGQVLLRSAGNDPLTYESQAYSILFTGSLRSGESVFWAIPAYRYIKFLEHALFGDGDMLYAAAQLAAFFGGVFWLFRNTRDRSIPAIQKILLLGLGCGLIFLGGYYVSGILCAGLSEYDTWILLLWALPGLSGMAGSGAILAGAMALSISFTIRPNQLFGILWILFLAAVGFWKKQKKTLLLAGILALGIALLPLAHNLYYGRAWVLTTTTGESPANMSLPPSTWLAFFRGDPTAATAVRDQIGMIFLISDSPRSTLPTLATMGVFFACWLAVTGFSIARRKISDALLLATPVFYLSVLSLYVVNNYYPRHIVMVYLSMAIVTIIVLTRDLPVSPAAAVPAVELPH